MSLGSPSAALVRGKGKLRIRKASERGRKNKNERTWDEITNEWDVPGYVKKEGRWLRGNGAVINRLA